jgi:hypothetical protein
MSCSKVKERLVKNNQDSMLILRLVILHTSFFRYPLLVNTTVTFLSTKNMNVILFNDENQKYYQKQFEFII